MDRMDLHQGGHVSFEQAVQDLADDRDSMEVERLMLPNAYGEDGPVATVRLQKGRTMGSAPVIDVDEESTLTLADIDADTGKYHDPTDDSEAGQGHFHATGEEFLECLRSGYCLNGDD